MSFIVYPAIDLRAGNVVRLKEGDLGRMTAYSDNPAGIARRWLSEGAGWLHVVNLDGAFGETDHTNRLALQDVLRIAKEFDAKIQFGGGMRTLDSIEYALHLGVSRAILGTIAIEQPDVVATAIQEFGAERIVVGIDARDGVVRVRGWRDDGGISATDLALQMRKLGVGMVIFTDVGRDGLGSGLNIPATRRLAEVSKIEVIASGGVHALADVIGAREANLGGVIIGRALYDGTIHLKDALESNVS